VAILYTAGHGSRDVDELVAMLREAGVRLVVDARSTPRSRSFPQFGYGPLGARLEAEGIGYDWRRVLGGLRRLEGRPRHPGLDEPSLQAYAEHMESSAFQIAAAHVAAEAEERVVCILCAEREPAHCHRSLIADWLVARGYRVVHLIAPGRTREHALHAAARLDGGRLCYLGGGMQRELF
jgi:uncharacterized protein (DUF488 family)